MKLKRLCTFLLAGAMVLSMAACSGNEVSSNQPTPTPAESPADDAAPEDSAPTDDSTTPDAEDPASDETTTDSIENTNTPGPPPADAPFGGTYIRPVLAGGLSADMMSGFSANAENGGFIRLLEDGYKLTITNRERQLAWNPTVVKEYPEVTNEDGTKTYTVTIHDDLVWNTGEPITAKDFVFAFMLGSSPEYAEIGGDATGGSVIVGFDEFNAGETKSFKGLRLIDDYTFSMQVKAEDAESYYILDSISASPSPLYAMAPGVTITDSENGATISDDFTAELLTKTILDPETGFRYKNPVTCGPYELVKSDPGTNTVELKRNEKYKGWFDGTVPHIDKIVSKAVTAETTADEFAKGNIDEYNSSSGEKIDAMLNRIESGEVKANYTIRPLNSLNEWRFQCDFGPVQFPEVRRALAYIIDRDEIVKQIYGGYASVVDSFLVEGMTDYQATKDELDATLTHYSYDLEKAKQNLIDGGWTLNESGGDFVEGTDKIRYKKVGEELMPLIIKWCYNESEMNTLYNTVVPPEAEKIGMKLETTKLDWAQVVSTLYRENGQPEYHVYTMGIILPEFSAYWYFFDDAPERMGLWNVYRISDPDLKNLSLEMKAVKPGDVEEFRSLYVKFQQKFNEVLPCIPVSTGNSYYFYNPKLKNYNPRAFDEWDKFILDAYIEE